LVRKCSLGETEREARELGHHKGHSGAAGDYYKKKDMAGAEVSREGQTWLVAKGGLVMLYPMLPESSEPPPSGPYKGQVL
jgi:hypothetical protein